MAEYDDIAFNNMNNAAPDFDIGGAIESPSKYETDMTYPERKAYQDTLMSRLQGSYSRDPHKGELGFRSWLKNMNWNLQDERFKGWDDFQNMPRSEQKTFIKENPEEFRLLEDSGELRRLADLHTGSLKDLVSIVESSPEYYTMRDKPLGMGEGARPWNKDLGMGPGPEESPTLREAMLHKGGIKRSEKIESGIEKWPELFKDYKKY